MTIPIVVTMWSNLNSQMLLVEISNWFIHLENCLAALQQNVPNIRPSNFVSIYSPNKNSAYLYQLHNSKYSEIQNSIFEFK